MAHDLDYAAANRGKVLDVWQSMPSVKTPLGINFLFRLLVIKIWPGPDRRSGPDRHRLRQNLLLYSCP